MNEVLEGYWNQLKEIWGKLSLQQRIVVSVVPVFMLVALVAFLAMSGRPQMSVLYSNLSSEDAGLIVQKLKDDKTPYEISNGDTILVPNNVVYEMRLQMATQGLPQGGAVGFEIFDKNKMGLTDFASRLIISAPCRGN